MHQKDVEKQSSDNQYCEGQEKTEDIFMGLILFKCVKTKTH